MGGAWSSCRAAAPRRGIRTSRRATSTSSTGHVAGRVPRAHVASANGSSTAASGRSTRSCWRRRAARLGLAGRHRSSTPRRCTGCSPTSGASARPSTSSSRSRHSTPLAPRRPRTTAEAARRPAARLHRGKVLFQPGLSRQHGEPAVRRRPAVRADQRTDAGAAAEHGGAPRRALRLRRQRRLGPVRASTRTRCRTRTSRCRPRHRRVARLRRHLRRLLVSGAVLGVRSLSFFSRRFGFENHHLDLANRVFDRLLPGGFLALDRRAIDLVSPAVARWMTTAPRQRRRQPRAARPRQRPRTC